MALHPEWRLTLTLAPAIATLAVYYMLPFEPPTLLTAFAFLVTGALYRVSQSETGRLFALAFMIAFAFTAYAQWRTMTNGPELLERATTATFSLAKVESVEDRATKGIRMVLTVTDKAGRLKDGSRIRISARGWGDIPVEPGDRLTVRARLEPLPGPTRPGGYDFRRTGYFSGLSAVGYALGAPLVHQKTGTNTIAKVRTNIAQRFIEHSGKTDAGALAAALTVGHRSALSITAVSALRDAGLAHLLAISGLHMGLVVLAAFFIIETLIASSARLSARFGARRAAALCAWIVGLSYLLLSGASVSTQRAFLMVSLVMLAIWWGRPVLSIRSLLIAAFCLLILRPDSVLHVGFQMSFAASAGLILSFERIGPWHNTDRSLGNRGLVDRIASAVILSLGVTLLTQAAVGPFALYHFQSLSLVALIANLIAVPVMTFWVMPWLMLAMILTPLGLEHIALAAACPALNGILDTAILLQGLPAAVLRTSALPAEQFMVGVACLLPCIMWRVKDRAVTQKVWVFAWCSIATLICLWPASRQPVAYITASASGIAMRTNTGWSSYNIRASSFSTESWLRSWGLAPNTPREPLAPACDAYSCIFTLGTQRLALPKTAGAVEEDCRNADVLILPPRTPHPLDCAARTLDRRWLRAHGPLALYDGLAWQPSMQRPHRPWHPGYRSRLDRINGSSATTQPVDPGS